MEYDSNRSNIKTLKKLFVKLNKHAGKFQTDPTQIKRLMGELYSNLTEDQQKEYRAWEEVQIFILKVQNDQTRS